MPENVLSSAEEKTGWMKNDKVQRTTNVTDYINGCVGTILSFHESNVTVKFTEYRSGNPMNPPVVKSCHYKTLTKL